MRLQSSNLNWVPQNQLYTVSQILTYIMDGKQHVMPKFKKYSIIILQYLVLHFISDYYFVLALTVPNVLCIVLHCEHKLELVHVVVQSF